MISELDDTIRQILVKEGKIDPAEIDVSFDIPNREWSSRISRPTLNCYLFDIRENRELRQTGWQMEKQDNGAAAGRRYPAIRYDLTYLITAWTRAVEDEHRLLWHALQTLARFSTLPEVHCQGALQRHELPIYTSICRPDGVLKSPGEFWSALENHLKPSLSYVVTMGLDRELISAGPPTLTTTFRFQQPNMPPEEQSFLGGTVRDKQGRAVAGVMIEVEGRALRFTSDEAGRFRIHSLTPGRYTLVATIDGTTQRREIEVLATNYDIVME